MADDTTTNSTITNTSVSIDSNNVQTSSSTNTVTQFELPPEHWIKSFWRPACAWAYILICLMDFIGFPLLNIMMPIVAHAFGVAFVYAPWQSLTLVNGGFIHMSFMTIIGVSAYSRGNAEMARIQQFGPSK